MNHPLPPEVDYQRENAANVLLAAFDQLPQHRAVGELLDRLGATTLNAALHVDTQERQNNVEMLRGIMHMFPVPGKFGQKHGFERGDRTGFEVSSPKEFAVVDSSILWVPVLFSERPAYIIGQRVTTEGMPKIVKETRRARNNPAPVVQLLLWHPGQGRTSYDRGIDLSYSTGDDSQDQLRTVYAYNHEFKAMEQEMLALYVHGVDPSVYTDRYSHHTRSAVLTSEYGFRLSHMPSKTSPLDFDGDVNSPEDLEQLYLRMGRLRIFDNFGDEFKDGVTNEMLDKFDVVRNIASLAMKFDCLEEVGRRIITRFDDQQQQ